MPSANYPQLPKGVWHGAWALLRKAPNRKLDDRALAAELGVQSTAAKAYARELIRLGILDEEFKPTSRANSWRQDGRNATLIQEILDDVYPEDLRHLAPIDDLDRDKIVRWFMNDGLGEGSAKNKAATYLMLAEGVDEDATVPSKSGSAGSKTKDEPKLKVKKSAASPPAATQKEVDAGNGSFTPELAVNVQIHISADATGEQIDAIFNSMKKYFGK